MTTVSPVMSPSRVSMKPAALAIAPVTTVARRVGIGVYRAALTGIRIKPLIVNLKLPRLYKYWAAPAFNLVVRPRKTSAENILLPVRDFA